MSGVVGTRTLVEVSMKQDARNIAPWIALITLLEATSLLGFALLLNDEETGRALTAAVGTNPALSLLFGPAHDLTTADGFNAWRTLGLGTFFAGLMAVFIVTRNSRGNEDSNQAELVASSVVGRQARLAAAIAMAFAASVMLGVVSYLVALLCGGDPLASLLVSACFTASGWVFAGVAAIASQLGSFARTANNLSVATLGALYLVRGVADSVPDAEWLIWWTPFGWLQEVRPSSENNAWPLLACAGLAVVLVAIAIGLQSRRDFGMGLIAPSPGPARGGVVTSLGGLALRIHRASMLSWFVAFLVIGSVFGYVASALGTVFADNPFIAQFLAAGGGSEGDLVFEFLSTLLNMMAIIAAVYGVQVVMRIYMEEAEYRAEPILSASVSRPAYYLSNAVIALLGPAIALVLGASALAITSSAAGTDVDLSDLVLQAVASIPALWILIGIALALVGAKPAVRLIAWLPVLATFALTILGPTFNLWDWILDISPLRHIPLVTAADADWWQLVWLGLIGAFFMIVAFARYSRRDLQYRQP